MTMKASMTGIVEVLDGVFVLLPAGSSCGHDVLYESTALLALGSETDLAPQNSLTELPLRKIVRRLDSFVIDERKEMLTVADDAFAHSGNGMTAANLSLDEDILDFDPKICHPPSKGTYAHWTVSDPVPPLEHQVGLVHQLLTYTAGLAFHLGKADESSQQVCPAELAQSLVDVVGTPTVRHQDPSEASQQLSDRLPPPAEMNHEHRDNRGRSDPQPGLLVALTPAGLVGMNHPGRLDVLASFLDRPLQSLADGLLAGGDRAEADGDAEHVGQKILDEPLALVVDTRQQRHQRLQPGTEASGWNSLRQPGHDDASAVEAGSGQQLPFPDSRPDRRDLHDLVAPGVVEVDLDVCAATSVAPFRLDDGELVDFVDRNQISEVGLVSRLGAALALGLLLAAALRLGPRRVARRGLG